jgi:anaerobic selenocysteine-containing dehydrogenase
MAGEAPRVYDAIKSTEFNVVVDLFMTPTAVACADLVLPAEMSVGRNSLRTWWTPLRAISKVTSYYEAKSDEQIILEVGKRLNPDAPAWKWFNRETKQWEEIKDDIDLLNQRLLEGEAVDEEGNILDFKTLQERVYVWPEFEYHRMETGKLRPDGEPGFNTPTGKIELYCTTLEAFGNDPLPYYEEPPESPVSTPELFKQYPLVLTTGHRSFEWFHSEQRQQKTMREFHPNPLVDMHPDTAEKYGVKNGEWCWIENKRGRCRMIANVDISMQPGVINAEHGWWFPEQEGAEPSLFGVFDSNSNNLTTQCVTGETGYGAPYKNTLAKIYPCTEENSKILPGEQVTRLGGFKYVRGE